MKACTSLASSLAPKVRSRSSTMSLTVRTPSQRLMMAPALPLSFTMPSG